VDSKAERGQHVVNVIDWARFNVSTNTV